MTPSPDIMTELAESVEALYNEELASEQAQRLERILADHPAARREYVRLTAFFVNLQSCCATLPTDTDTASARAADSSNDAVPPDVPFPVLRSPLPSALPTLHSPLSTLHSPLLSSGWPVAYLIATVIFSIALTIAALVHVSQPASFVLPSPSGGHHEVVGAGGEGSISLPSPVHGRGAGGEGLSSSIVARITGMVDCQWATDAATVVHGASVPLGQKYALASGLMEITYNTGARVILQGPMTYEVESENSGLLSVGKLTGKVTAERAKGFAIRTPTAVVTDLGTEFGVQVSQEGSTTARVYRGVVEVQSTDDNGKQQGPTVRLTENGSVRVDRRSQRPMVVVPASKSVDFVRGIPKPKMPKMKTFDLVDVVAGGDGFSGRRGASIDPTSGRRNTEVFIRNIHIDESVQYHYPFGEDIWAIGDGKFHRAEELPFVDGVFIPDGSKGPITVDSAGHTFADCPKTRNFAPYLVWASGAIPQPELSTTMNGIDYARSGHGLLWMHANLGITFDLDAIRKATPGWKVRRFMAMVANMEVISKDGINRSLGADYWVLVDGRVRDRRCQITAYNGANPISVVINSSDRFLTLVSTDGGNGIHYDLIAFGDPRLELIEKNDRQPSLKSTAKGGQ